MRTRACGAAARQHRIPAGVARAVGVQIAAIVRVSVWRARGAGSAAGVGLVFARRACHALRAVIAGVTDVAHTGFDERAG